MTQPHPISGSPPSRTYSHPAAQPVLRLESHVLLAGGREAVIVHQGEEYRLRVTRLDKLILTK